MESTALISSDIPPFGGTLTNDLRQLHGRIAELLQRAGVCVPDARLAALAETVLADAIQISLQWLEIGADGLADEFGRG